jgi:glutathione synthase/RimK-type ligase-like ATP-grasp enzyme
MSDLERVAILFENDAWLGDLFGELERRDIPYEALRTDDSAIALDHPPPYALAFNRVSPSSYLRGHGPAIPFARSLLDIFSAHGRRVINGASSFRFETSKLDQHLLFKRLGVACPRTILFNNQQEITRLARDFPFPAIIKPDCGGSGAFVRRVDSYDHFRALLDAEPELFAPDHLLLLQQQLQPRDGAILRTEFIDGEFVYAMRVHATNTFNLCPAESCERHMADAESGVAARVEFEPYPDVAPAAVAQAREIVRASSLDVGGVEFVEDAHGVRWFFDINATSVYREDICRALEIDAVGMLVDFVAREFHKEVAKHAVSRAGTISPPQAI